MLILDSRSAEDEEASSSEGSDAFDEEEGAAKSKTVPPMDAHVMIRKVCTCVHFHILHNTFCL